MKRTQVRTTDTQINPETQLIHWSDYRMKMIRLRLFLVESTVSRTSSLWKWEMERGHVWRDFFMSLIILTIFLISYSVLFFSQNSPPPHFLSDLPHLFFFSSFLFSVLSKTSSRIYLLHTLKPSFNGFTSGISVLLERRSAEMCFKMERCSLWCMVIMLWWAGSSKAAN